MDPFAHTFMGASIAASGLRKYAPLATAALVLGANAPDIDIAVAFRGDYSGLAHRRGWTHGILAWLLLPFMVTGLLLAWDKLVRRRRNTGLDPARAGSLLMLSGIGVLSHPALDWLNNYGIRLLMPFDGRWFYGDALFIIDPWVWLALGGVTFMCWSRHRASWLLWGILFLLWSRLILGSSLVPEISKVLWCAALLLLFICRARVGVITGATMPRIMVTLVVFYMSACALASHRMEIYLKGRLQEDGHGDIEQVMVAPTPANPFHNHVVAETKEKYLLGRWSWFSESPLQLEPASLPRNSGDKLFLAAAESIAVQRYLSWSRFPYAEIEQGVDGYRVRFLDARYALFNGGIAGPEVTLNRSLEIQSVENSR